MKRLYSHLCATLTAFVLLWLGGGSAAGAATATAPTPLLLISMDGFRWDYCQRFPDATPNLRRLMREGVSARALIPMFPSTTFANHYSIVTGLYPANHGVINNIFFDAQLGEFFRYKVPAANHDPRWWGGEPIWITAVKQGRKSATYFWPGSEVTFPGGLSASIVKSYDYSQPFESRRDELFSWLHRPESERPAVITFYFEETNRAGHYFGPDSPEIVAAVKLLDAQIGSIVERANAENIPLNLVIVSDHGFASTDGKTKTAMLDDYIDFDAVQVDFDGPVAGLRPNDGNAAALVQRLTASLPAHYKPSLTENLPARWHLRDHPRIPPVWIIPDPGWRIQRQSTYVAVKDETLKGDHGYDPAAPEMHGIFIACGPAFKSNGASIDAVENIHVYNLLCAALHLTPAPNDGDDRLVRAALR